MSKFKVAGVDEVGRGPLAGPLYVCSVVLPDDPGVLDFSLIKDSKKLSEKQREAAYEQITSSCVYEVISIDVSIIEEKNILGATMHGMYAVMKSLLERCSGIDSFIVDGNHNPMHSKYVQVDEESFRNITVSSVVRADEIHREVSAASIVAKVMRDRFMKKMHNLYPEYGWNTNVGYGTKKHTEAIEKHGITPLHRRSFLKKFL